MKRTVSVLMERLLQSLAERRVTQSAQSEGEGGLEAADALLELLHAWPALRMYAGRVGELPDDRRPQAVLDLLRRADLLALFRGLTPGDAGDADASRRIEGFLRDAGLFDLLRPVLERLVAERLVPPDAAEVADLHAVSGSLLTACTLASISDRGNDALFARVALIARAWEGIKDVIRIDHPVVEGNLRQALHELLTAETQPTETQIDDRLAAAAFEGEELHLADTTLWFPDRRSAFVVLQEILVREEYYFQTDDPAPRILDCGSHFGLSVYYFKKRFPDARIVCFEPDPRNQAVLTKNIERCGFTDVEVEHSALAGVEGTASFRSCKTQTMAGSLTSRMEVVKVETERVEVPAVVLSRYLDQPTHFLKLDIEGVEDEVLAEAREQLPLVKHIFCEYHQGLGLASDRLAKILCILAEAGFDVEVGKAFMADRETGRRPILNVGGRYSAGIWATNRNWRKLAKS